MTVYTNIKSYKYRNHCHINHLVNIIRNGKYLITQCNHGPILHAVVDTEKIQRRFNCSIEILYIYADVVNCLDLMFDTSI